MRQAVHLQAAHDVTQHPYTAQQRCGGKWKDDASASRFRPDHPVNPETRNSTISAS